VLATAKELFGFDSLKGGHCLTLQRMTFNVSQKPKRTRRT
jgi:hypothetical protein